VQDITERKRAEKELQRTHDTLLQAQKIAHLGSFEFVAATRVTVWSEEEYRIYGLDPAKPSPTYDEMLARHIHPDDVALLHESFTKAMQSVAIYELEHRIVRPEGSVRWVYDLAHPYFDEQGELVRYVGTTLDITERKEAGEEIRKLNAELEQRVSERTAELELANKELESFSYSVSHDLRAPLRSIDGFSRIVIKQCADKLDDENRENLNRVRAASQRMGELIDDLLKLSRIGRAELRRTTFDFSALALEVITYLHEAEPARQVTCVVAPGLSATADRALLRVVLNNLLGNAWKFSGRQADGRIEFGAIEHDGEQVFFVRDNGAGFDPAYASKLFTPFQRLHTKHEFPGSGIGLATVQRIIHRHRGRVWAEAQVNQGATIYFTLSAKPNET
jgi:PAS domain S-box-containing protein